MICDMKKTKFFLSNEYIFIFELSQQIKAFIPRKILKIKSIQIDL